MVFDPVLQFVVHRDVLAQQPVEILAGIVVRVGGLAAKIHKTVQPVLGEGEVKLDALGGVLFLAEFVLLVVRKDALLGLRKGNRRRFSRCNGQHPGLVLCSGAVLSA